MTVVFVLVSHPDLSCQLAWDNPAGSARRLIIQPLSGSIPTNLCTESIDLMGYRPLITTLIANDKSIV